MNMQEHILAGLRGVFEHWEALITSLSPEQITAPLVPSAWTPKDIIAHLWAWQQRSIARLEAAYLDRPPQFPAWFPAYDPDVAGVTDEVNALIYAAFRDQPWQNTVQNWRTGFLRCLELGAGIPERELLDADRFVWLKGHSLAFVLVSSYDHHQEHYEVLVAWLNAQAEGWINASLPGSI